MSQTTESVMDGQISASKEAMGAGPCQRAGAESLPGNSPAPRQDQGNAPAPKDVAGKAAPNAGPARLPQPDEPASGAEKAEGQTAPNPEDLPISDWSKVDLGLPEDFKPDPSVLESLGRAAIAAKLTPAQVKALAQWNMEAFEAHTEALRQSGMDELRKAWGGNADANQRAALSLVSRVDRALRQAGLPESAFSRALSASGADMNVDIVKGLYEISRWLSEDSLGKSDAARPQRPETAYEGLAQALEQARRGG